MFMIFRMNSQQKREGEASAEPWCAGREPEKFQNGFALPFQNPILSILPISVK